jgi:hypothetical protein
MTNVPHMRRNCLPEQRRGTAHTPPSVGSDWSFCVLVPLVRSVARPRLIVRCLNLEATIGLFLGATMGMGASQIGLM